MREGYELKYISQVPKEEYPCGSIEEQREALKSSKQLAEFAAYRKEMKDHPYAPAYHFWAPDGNINDPNGLCFWNGYYHMFYQAYPPVADCRQHWGHAISTDMVNWKDLPIAIYPDVEKAVFSGSSLVEEDRVIAMYHGWQIGNMIATSSDPLLLNWAKNDNCPVIPHIEADVKGKPYRIFDPFLWKQEDGYYALSGSYYGEGERNTAADNIPVEHVFFSQDLSNWTYLGELFDGEFGFEAYGNDGACPYFWPIGKNGKYLFFHFSHQTGPHCFLGTYDPIRHKFHPEKHMDFCHGPIGISSYQAPCLTPDGEGGLYLVYNTKDANMTLKRQGCMTVMHHVTLDEKENIIIQPVDLSSLHDQEFKAEKLELKAFRKQKLDLFSKQLDISFKAEIGDAKALVLKVLESEDGYEHTDIVLYRGSRPFQGGKAPRYYVSADTTYSSMDPNAEGRCPEVFKVPEAENGVFDVRVLVDKSIIEVFVNGQVTMMQMVYPSEKSCGVSLEALGADVKVENFSAWTMKSIYE